MTTLADVFSRLRSEGRTGLVTYVTAGDPDLPRSLDVLRALDQAGADVLEVGVPFSDPLADGPVIQRASERALAAGATLTTILDALAGARDALTAPRVIFTYANPVLRLGIDRFRDLASRAGISGVLVLDLPIEEAGTFRDGMLASGIDTIFLLSPTTSDARIRQVAQLGRGFLYGISRLGVTGARDAVATGARDLAARVRRETDLPIAIGFGISRPEHVREVGTFADAAVVGSALVSIVAEASPGSQLADRVGAYVRWLKGDTAAAGQGRT